MSKFKKHYPLEKYKYEMSGSVVTAHTTYAGKPVSARAVCHPDDEFSIKKGQELAAARCDEKVTYKRYKAALDKEQRLRRQLSEIQRQLAKQERIVDEATNNWWESHNKLTSILRGLGVEINDVDDDFDDYDFDDDDDEGFDEGDIDGDFDDI